ncbi:unnamed protein product [Rotaria sp. Silwood2]|nr:unnamed protein product [Rotaria sp. Silwood2]CAF3359298.1 unnamed protein product [Rotaria sp. Silwood2]CAF4473859.1 unnamed protein product [Rotaria sp. Silwood2]CAF4484698.1 unnamed protein product [Rotaria sp. Silwood2]
MTMTHIQWDKMDNYVGNGNVDSWVHNFGTPTFSFDQWLLKSESNRQQFIHLRQFMTNDLSKTITNENLSRQQLKDRMGFIAKKMIERNDALTNLLKQHYPNHIRLSIHQHPSDGEKFTIRFFTDIVSGPDEGCAPRTPWHNVLVINVEGTLTLMPYRKLNLNTEHIPITFKEQVWCFLKLPCDTPSSIASTLKIMLLGNSPRFGLWIDCCKKVDVLQLSVAWMKMLLGKFGFLVLRQPQNSLNKDNYSKFCEQFAPPVTWKSGSLLEIKPETTPTSSHSSRDPLPLHFDLCFSPECLQKKGSYNDYVAQYFMLYCIKASHPHANDKTTLVNGRLLLESIDEKMIKHWKTIEITSSMPLSYYEGQNYIYPIIMSHPKTNENIFRYLEMPNSSIQPVKTKCSIDKIDIDATEYQEFDEMMKKIMRDPKWYMEHTWNDDDLVIIENHLLLHGRTAINEESERELWCIQVY